MKSNGTTGPDSALQKIRDDSLGRGPVVKTIANLIRNTEPRWSLRIGLYGRWGTGKTTVIYFLKEALGASHCQVVDFNPWGYESKEEMFFGLSKAILDVLPPDAGKKQRAKLFARKNKNMTTLIPSVASLKELKSSIDAGLARLTSYASSDVSKAARLTDARIVVFIDDLDRLDPKLVPTLLFTLKEVLESCPLVFILACDPEIVGEALREYHPGFESSRLFLEKILDYHFELPEPRSEQAMTLIWDEIHTEKFKGMRDAMIENRDCFFSNPRKAKMLVRHVGAYLELIDRYESGEIDKSMIVKAVFLRLFAPSLLTDISAVKGIGPLMSRIYHSKFDTKSEDASKASIELKEKVEGLPGLIQEEKKKVFEMLEGLGQNYAMQAAEKLTEAFEAIDAPPELTRKEVRNMLDEAPDASPTELLRKQLVEGDEIRQALLFPYFTATLDLYAHSLIAKADARVPSEEQTAVSLARRCAGILVELCQISLSHQKGFYLRRESLERVGSLYRHWSNFHSRENFPAPVDDHFRFQEAQLLELLVEAKCASDEEMLETLQPWFPDHSSDPVFVSPLLDKLAALIQSRMAADFPSSMLIDGYVMDAIRRKESARRDFLFRQDSPLWRSEGFKTALHSAKSSEAVQANFRDYFMLIEHQVTGSSIQPTSGVDQVAADYSRMQAIYTAATVQPPPVRQAGSLSESRKKLEHKFRYNLEGASSEDAG